MDLSHLGFDIKPSVQTKDQKNKKERSEQKEQDKKYVGAPYNFVSFSNKVYSYEEKLPTHNAVEENLHSGELSYEVTAKTDILVDDGKHQFYRNAEGMYAIPGSSIRGLIRNNVQILGFSSFYDDIDDYTLMYRNVASRKEEDRYKTVLGSKMPPLQNGKGINILKNVRAGYICKENGAYVIYRTCVESIKKELGDMNYYVLNEKYIVDNYLEARGDAKKFSYPIFLEHGKSIMQHEFKRFKKGSKGYEGIHNTSYKPFFKKVSYEIVNLKTVTAVGEPKQFSKEGYVISTGYISGKKVIYIIPEIDRSKKILVSDEDVLSFKIDFKKRENTLKSFGEKEFFNLPGEGEQKPVFYIELDGRLYFGFTPRLRLFYDHTIKYGLKKSHEKGLIDYSKAIFGYAGKEMSYKSRVSFTDAVAVSKPKFGKEEKVVLAEPKPSSYMDYLKGKKPDDIVTYNRDEFELRGVKQYWLHSKENPKNTGNKNENVGSTLRPLSKGTVFTGKVRFHNLTDDELGLLIWSIQLDKKSWMNIGKAKPYGYGNIKLDVTEIKEVNMKKAYDLNQLTLDPFEPVDGDALITIYKNKMKEFLGGKKVEEQNCIKEFFAIKDTERMPDESQIRYMEINKKEYQNRTATLDRILRVVKK